MSPLHLPSGAASYPEFEDLARRITDGDGLAWQGDPRLWLGIGVLTDTYGRTAAHRLEVWRDTEQGETVLIGTWHPSERFRIPYDLSMMRLGAPGVKPVEVRVDESNAKHEADLSATRQDAMAADVEELAYRLVREQGHAKTTFQVPGTKDDA